MFGGGRQESSDDGSVACHVRRASQYCPPITDQRVSDHAMASTSTVPNYKELSHKTLLANKDHQYALQVYTERLEAELETVDKFLVSECKAPHATSSELLSYRLQ